MFVENVTCGFRALSGLFQLSGRSKMIFKFVETMGELCFHCDLCASKFEERVRIERYFEIVLE